MSYFSKICFPMEKIQSGPNWLVRTNSSHFFPTSHSLLIGILKLATLGVFIPWKLANAINQSFSFPSWSAGLPAPHWIILVYQLVKFQTHIKNSVFFVHRSMIWMLIQKSAQGCFSQLPLQSLVPVYTFMLIIKMSRCLC